MTARILAWPAARSTNQVTAKMADQLQRGGFEVLEHDLRTMWRRHDLLFLHWPERIVRSPSWPKTIVHTAIMGVTLAAAVIRRTPIVLVVHNLKSHDRHHPRLEDLFHRVFDPLVTTTVHLSAASSVAAARERPHLQPRHEVVTRHGADIASAGAQSPPSVTDEAEVPPTAGVVLATFGAMREYKGYEDLLDVLNSDPDLCLRLELRGSNPSPELEGRLQTAAARDPRVELSVGFVGLDELEAQVRGAHSVVLPYRNILNSGSALHVLALGGRVIAPRMGTLPELAEDVGADWLHLYEPPLSATSLRRAIDWASQPPTELPDLTPYSWTTVGNHLIDAVEQTLADAQ